MKPAVVIGVGNPVRADDAVGLHVAQAVRRALQGSPLAAQVDVEELWAGGLRLVEAMTGYRHAIVIDALETPAEPGSLHELDIASLAPCRAVNCVHDASLPAALAMWRDAGEPLPERITVLGIAAADLVSLVEALSPAVAAAVPLAVQRVLQALAAALPAVPDGPEGAGASPAPAPLHAEECTA